MTTRIASKGARWVVLGLVLGALAGRPAAADPEAPVRFDVPRSFRVGNRLFDSGVIAVRSLSAYTPSTTIVEVWVNDECLGMLSARRSVSQDPPLRNEAIFRQDDDGRLEMVGFRVTGRSTGTNYRFP